jgi:predicted regulator of Ras-like GTPase activity (Roadblock/LC7/MglB family)/DNA-binding response OmpR family regulator
MDNQENLKKVLIVDDEEDMIWSLHKNLNNDNLQVDISIASSGEEAIAVLEQKDIDLVVTDIKMPGMSGIELLFEIKKRFPHTGVIVMTAFPSPERKSEAIEHGSLHYLEKPFDINELRDIIGKALEQGELFKGTVSGIELTDIIQINCLSRATSALKVKTVSGSGTVYFHEGSILHAECKNLQPEEAFYEILTFKGGMLESLALSDPPKRTIEKDVDALLLEGSRRIDERKEELKNKKKKLEAPAVVVPAELPGSQNKIFMEDAIMEGVKKLLSEFTNLPGVNTACLVGRDGFLLDSIAISGTDTEMIGAIASSGFGASESMGIQLEKGQLTMTMIEYNNGPVMLSPIGSEAFLVVVADKEANLGMIRLKIKKHARDIEATASI